HGSGPDHAHGSPRPFHRVSPASTNEHPPGVRGQFHDAGHVLGRQQRGGQHRQARAAAITVVRRLSIAFAGLLLLGLGGWRPWTADGASCPMPDAAWTLSEARLL